MRPRILVFIVIASLVVITGVHFVTLSSTVIAQPPEPTSVAVATVLPELIDAGPPMDMGLEVIDERNTPEIPDSTNELTAVGTAFTYQGRLSESNSFANGTFDLRFTLHDSATGGIQVGNTVDRNDVAVVDGLFTVVLDFGGNALTGNARYLQIAVRPGASTGSYAVLSPRQQIRPAPYAIHAENAEKLAGLNHGAMVPTITLLPGETKVWAAWGHPKERIVIWSVYPLTLGGRVSWYVEAEIENCPSCQGHGLMRYFIFATNNSSVTTDAELRFVILD